MEGTIDLGRLFPRQLSELSGNAQRIAVLARAYRGKSIDSIWSNGEFVEPDSPPPFRIAFRGRRGWSDTAHMAFEQDGAVITINNPYQSGRGKLTRVGEIWPSTILVRLKRKSPTTPGPKNVRVANGRMGVDIKREEDRLDVVAGEMQGALDLGRPWGAEAFLNGGKPDAPITLEAVKVVETDEAVEIVLPVKIIEGNPDVICFEWGSGRVR